MSMKEWMNLDIDELELVEVSEVEKQRVKQHVLKKRRQASIWRRLAAVAIIMVGATTFTGFAFPSVASQIPFMDNVIDYFQDDDRSYKGFDIFSTDVGLIETSNGITVMIDDAIYDGTNVIVSFAFETEHDFGQDVSISAPHWFSVAGEIGAGGSMQITKISETRYVGLARVTPFFKDEQYPETVNVTWEPKVFYSTTEDLKVKGDWSFAFSLNRLNGNKQLINQTVQHQDISFTLQSIEFTDISTIISYEQLVSDELLEKWDGVTPLFYITDDLGHTYVNGLSGPSTSVDSQKTLNGSTTFDAIQEGASQLIIQPVEMASLWDGKDYIDIKLKPIIIDLKK
ncbi:DUF4179 domain-containing protein [Lysinibacillus sp. FSL H8-0500]|uniref:DUF4179 domain-containing protein n=1 Tax=Lysinibacillus sp. FSL H8-0500 TaxID=2921393 RepID=UPI003100F313